MLRKKLLIDDRALDIFRASSKILQAGVRSGLCLYDIALTCCRHDDAGKKKIGVSFESVFNVIA